MLFAAITVTLLTALSQAQVHYNEPCPHLPVFKNFDWERYLGKWFEQERFFTIYQNIGQCWSGTYLKDEYSGDISVRLDFRDIVLRRPGSVTVSVFRKKPYAAPNRLTYTIPGVPIFEDNYEVLATDYKSWTIEYSCRNVAFGSLRFAWILTRSPRPHIVVIQQAKSIMKKFGIDVYRLERHENTCVKKY